jgi:hypothetical protein
MYKFYILLLLTSFFICLTPTVLAQRSYENIDVDKLTKKQKLDMIKELLKKIPPDMLKPEFTRSEVINYVRKLSKELVAEKKYNNKRLAVTFNGYASVFYQYANFKYISAETGIQGKWFFEVYNILKKMYVPRKKMDLAFLVKDKKAFAASSAEYTALLRKFNYLVKNWKKYLISKTDLSMLRKKRAENEKRNRSKRAKYSPLISLLKKLSKSLYKNNSPKDIDNPGK